jgi:hypothetical protein
MDYPNANLGEERVEQVFPAKIKAFPRLGAGRKGAVDFQAAGMHLGVSGCFSVKNEMRGLKWSGVRGVFFPAAATAAAGCFVCLINGITQTKPRYENGTKDLSDSPAGHGDGRPSASADSW